MCEDCQAEYTDPGDRRYHAQTIACPRCGPELWYELPGSGERNYDKPIGAACSALRRGEILAVKGLGGAHLACDASNDGAVRTLRERLGRPNQPFALMATEEMVEANLRLTEAERELLTGPRRPIVLLPVEREDWPSKKVAPGLHNAGVMLPYTGLHHLIFDRLDFPLVMTSANIPGEPMLIDNGEIRDKLAGIVDGRLLHDRRVVSRVDDSVVRFSGGAPKFIRRSRGWVPEPLEVDLGEESMLAVGAEQDNVIGLYVDGKIYLSQYLGDIEGPDHEDFLEEALDRLLKLTSSSLPATVAHDLHPEFLTTQKARQWGERTVPVQHHKAHVGSLLAEHQLTEMVGIVMDGLGLGEDGTIWGGEVLVGRKTSFTRAGALSRAYMPGGDLATEHPARMAGGIIYPLLERGEIESLGRGIEKMNLTFPGGKEERRATIEQLKTNLNTPVTTSSGRFLDAVAALLDVCRERTYEGEPAMRLESLAVEGDPVEIEAPINERGDIPRVDQSEIFRQLIELTDSHPPAVVAATAQNVLARGLARVAVQVAEGEDIDTVGFSGGVAYNDAISRAVESLVARRGLRFVTNRAVPVGDGGIPLGQLWIAGRPNPPHRD